MILVLLFATGLLGNRNWLFFIASFLVIFTIGNDLYVLFGHIYTFMALTDHILTYGALASGLLCRYAIRWISDRRRASL